MKYKFDKYKDTEFVLIQRGNVELRIHNGETFPIVNEEIKQLALDMGGKPVVTNKRKTKKLTAVKE